MSQLLDPTLDVVFKQLFANEQNKDLLLSLLTAVLNPPEPLQDVEVLNPEIDKESFREKGIVLDVRTRLADGRWIHVEMQSRPQRGFRQRGLFYWSKLYGSQLQRGDEYFELAPVVSLFILDFIEFPSERFHLEFYVLERFEGHLYHRDLSIHTLELPKVPAIPESFQGSGDSQGHLLLRWARFLKVRNSSDLEQLAMTDPIFARAQNALEHLSADPKAQALVEERKFWAWNHRNQLHLARVEGREEGLEEGRVEGEAKGQILLLEKQLQLKFGVLPASARARLSAATQAELSLWAERILTAAALDEVFL